MSPTSLKDELTKLVGFPTVSNRPVTELASHLARRAEDLGFRVELFQDPDHSDKQTVIATAGPLGEAGGLTVTGHMDVVPTEGQPWTSDPFRVVERDGRLIGRGTADMKGFIVACMAALEHVDLSSLSAPLVLIWTHDEEIGCQGSAKLVDAWQAAGRETFPRACLVGEPTDFRILRMHPGHVAVEVVVHGEAAHSSRPDLGRNAIEGAAAVVHIARQLAAELRAEAVDHLPELEQPWVAVNVARIQGGSAINIVPDRCVVQIGYRPLPGMDALEPWARLQARMHELGTGLSWEGRVMRVTPAMLTDTDTQLQALLMPHACSPELGAAGFATDGGHLARLGLQPLVFGPGSINVAHKADEYVPVDALARAVDVVRDVVRQRCLR